MSLYILQGFGGPDYLANGLSESSTGDSIITQGFGGLLYLAGGYSTVGDYVASASGGVTFGGARELVAGYIAYPEGGITFGGSAVPVVTRVLACATGVFTVTGNAITLTATGRKQIAIETGVFSVTGNDVGLLASRRLECSAASFSWAGSAIGLYHGRVLAIETATFTVTANDVGAGGLGVYPNPFAATSTTTVNPFAATSRPKGT